MKRITLFASVFALALIFAAAAPAATIEGTLVDVMCSAKVVKEGQKAAHMHTKECALMPPCKASGYGVFTKDNKFIKFNDAGNTKAVTALEGTDKKDNLQVEVTGDVDGSEMSVSNLKLL